MACKNLRRKTSAEKIGELSKMGKKPREIRDAVNEEQEGIKNLDSMACILSLKRIYSQISEQISMPRRLVSRPGRRLICPLLSRSVSKSVRPLVR